MDPPAAGSAPGQAGASPPLGRRPRLPVSTPVFAGPLELLLTLVEREEIDLFEIRISELTDAYLTALASLEEPDPAEMAEFLWLAARLLLLKSIRLLPGEDEEPEEAELLGWEEDVRLRLIEYRHVKEVAEQLMERQDQDRRSFPPPAREVAAAGQEQPIEVSALVIAFQSLLERLPPRPLVVQGNAWTLEDKLEHLAGCLRRGAFDLADLILECEDRLEAVVTFVALLELLRRGTVRVRQSRAFGSILVEPVPAVPRARK
ncbi:MAG: segregation/condensation protein A, partial [Candidatus Dormibacteraeota bacterium]|nr:segregation/condensation protein A [Candidatus Dormibacteraeota bacterium]